MKLMTEQKSQFLCFETFWMHRFGGVKKKNLSLLHLLHKFLLSAFNVGLNPQCAAKFCSRENRHNLLLLKVFKNWNLSLKVF